MDWPLASIIITIILGLFPIIYKLIPSKTVRTVHHETVNVDAKFSEFQEKFKNFDDKIDDLKEYVREKFDQLWNEIRGLRK